MCHLVTLPKICLSLRPSDYTFKWNVDKCLSKWIKVNKWDYLKMPHRNSKIIFCLDWKAKLERAYSFRGQSDKIPVSWYLLILRKNRSKFQNSAFLLDF